MNLHDYDWVVLNHSAGKDSQAMLETVIRLADAQGYPRTRLVVAHATFEEEWPGTEALAREHAAHYGLRCEVVTRTQGTLLDYVRARGKWPSSGQRYCTSEFKRGPIGRIFTKLTKETHDTLVLQNQEHDAGQLQLQALDAARQLAIARRRVDRSQACRGGLDRVRAVRDPRDSVQSLRTPTATVQVRILSVFGFRAEESPARKKRQVFSVDTRNSNGRRQVDIWLPIHAMLLPEVWATIAQAGTKPHYAYALGMSRLSCRFCIFAPKRQLILAGRQPENRALLDEYVWVELTIGHKFRQDCSIESVRDAVDAGEVPVGDDKDDGCWNM